MKEIKIWDSTATDLNAGTTQKIETVSTDIKSDGSGNSILTKHIKASFFSGVTYPVYTDTITAFYPDADTESTSVDGLVSTYGTTSDWNTAHDLSAGDYVYDNQTTLPLGYFRSNLSSNNFGLYRWFVLFDTSGIPDGDPIDSATLSFYAIGTHSLSAGGSSEPSVKTSSIVQSSPASNTALVLGDFDQCGDVDDPDEGIDSGDRFDPAADFTTSQYNDIDLNSTGIGWIAKDGITKLGVRFTFDITDDDPGANKHMVYMNCGSADQSGTSKDPKLTVTHGTGFTPKAITMF